MLLVSKARSIYLLVDGSKAHGLKFPQIPENYSELFFKTVIQKTDAAIFSRI
tara:strand:- start:760 stop:915 length:156 start_codon:yes stop_codon:yes gene_type:complete